MRCRRCGEEINQHLFAEVLSRFSPYLSYFGRLRRSRGFGVHSPFAFRFVLDVMCQKHPYYAYEAIAHLHLYAVRLAKHKAWSHRVLPMSEAKALFRVINYYNPQHILHIGSTAGFTVAVSALPSSKSRHWLYVPAHESTDMLTSCAERVTRERDLTSAAEHFAQAIASTGAVPVVVIDMLDSEAEAQAEAVVRNAIDRRGVIVFCNIHHRGASQRLCTVAKQYAQRGMWFGNYYFGVLVANPKLPRQDFMLRL